MAAEAGTQEVQLLQCFLKWKVKLNLSKLNTSRESLAAE
jgi:hypothetical protein